MEIDVVDTLFFFSTLLIVHVYAVSLMAPPNGMITVSTIGPASIISVTSVMSM